MRHGLPALLLLTFLSCVNPTADAVVDHQDWSGEYFFGSGGPAHSFLTLSADGTYEANGASCVGFAEKELGRWHAEEGMLYLVPKGSDSSQAMIDQVYHLARRDGIRFVVSPRLWSAEIPTERLLNGAHIHSEDVAGRGLWRRGWPMSLAEPGNPLP